GSRVIVKDADRCYGVIRRIDYIVGHEASDITDDGNGALLDPSRQLLGHSRFCLGLTDGSVHGSLLIVGDQVLGIPLAPEHRWRDGPRLPSLRPCSLDLQLRLKNLAGPDLAPDIMSSDRALGC